MLMVQGILLIIAMVVGANRNSPATSNEHT